MPPPEEERVTVGEVSRALTQFRVDVSEDFKDVKRQIGSLDVVTRAEFERRLAPFEARWEWGVRIIVGAVIVALLSLVVVGAGGR